MGRWEKELSKKSEQGTTPYKKKGALGLKSLLMIPVLLFIIALTAFFTKALNWDLYAALLTSLPIVLIPFTWLVIKFQEDK